MLTKERHKIFWKPIGPIPDWATWKSMWKDAAYVESCSGLLHVAFDVLERDAASRADGIGFLLRIADGWRDENAFARDDDREGARYRKALAEKAFKALAERLFRRRPLGEYGEPAWLRGALVDSLFSGLLDFFGDGERRGSLLSRNLSYDPPKTHHEVWAREFLLELVNMTWDLENGARGIFHASEEALRLTWRRRCADARPSYVRILHGIGRLDLLTARSLSMDDASLAVLRDLALRNPFLPDEKYASQEEALLKGWPAARVLAVVEAVRRARGASR